MNNELKDNLRALGWSEELIETASSVSERVEQASVESVNTDFDHISSSGTLDRVDIKILPSNVNTFVNFSISKG